MEFEESKAICINCNYFFPASDEEATEYGICLYDKVFEPFIEELMENQNFNSCKELIEEKKFPCDTQACEHFEQCEEFEIDDDSHLARELRNLKNSPDVNIDAIKTAIFLDQVEKIDWKTVPVDRYVVKLSSPDKDKQLEAASTLGALANSGNEKALDQLIKYFKELPSPSTLDEVHFKIAVFRHLEPVRNKSTIIPHLIDELYHLQSNNTTRQWISRILEYLQRCPINKVSDPLEKLLKEKKFSSRLRNRIRNIIIGYERNEF